MTQPIKITRAQFLIATEDAWDIDANAFTDFALQGADIIALDHGRQVCLGTLTREERQALIGLINAGVGLTSDS